MEILMEMSMEMLIILLIERPQQQMNKIIIIQPIIMIIVNKIIKISQQTTKIKHLYKSNSFVKDKIKSNTKILSQNFQIVNVSMDLGI